MYKVSERVEKDINIASIFFVFQKTSSEYQMSSRPYTSTLHNKLKFRTKKEKKRVVIHSNSIHLFSTLKNGLLQGQNGNWGPFCPSDDELLQRFRDLFTFQKFRENLCRNFTKVNKSRNLY